MELQNKVFQNFDMTIQDSCIFMEDDRHIFISISAFGELRKDLIDNIGMERMKGFLIRYGWELGKQDAIKVKDKGLHDMKEMIHYGPFLHTLKGHVKADAEIIEIDEHATPKFRQIAGTWKNSYEAVEHLRLFGKSDAPVCFTLVGYASGYLSELLNLRVIFKETTCKAKGDPHCTWVGKPVELWGKEADEILKYYREEPIVQELEQTYETLLIERNNLKWTAKINQQLTEALIRGHDLSGIVKMVDDITSVPLVIEDKYFRVLASSKRLDAELNTICTNFREILDQDKYFEKLAANPEHVLTRRTQLYESKSGNRLVTPIYLQGKVHGYCSFVRIDTEHFSPEVCHMILERISTVCSLYLLNEKTKFETKERMKGQFLEELINNQIETKLEIVQRGNYFNLNLDAPYYIGVLKSKLNTDDVAIRIKFHDQLMEAVTNYFKQYNKNVLLGQRTNYLIMLLPEIVFDNRPVQETMKQNLVSLQKQFKNAELSLGVSKRFTDITKAEEGFRQAQAAVRLSNTTNAIITFDTIGLLGSLINEDNSQTIYANAHQILSPLGKVEDEQFHESVHTLYRFLENGGRLEQTATQLMLSVSGLRYRIRQIEEALQRDLRNPQDSHQLLLAIQSLILIGKLSLDR